MHTMPGTRSVGQRTYSNSRAKIPVARWMNGDRSLIARLFVAALSLATAVAGRAEEPPPRFQGIVFVTIDTIRVDHMGCYGYPRDTTPFLTSLLDHSLRFDSAYAAMPATLPSHATMFTGLYPLQTGVTRNGLKLDAAFETLAESLGKSGWQTLASVSGQFSFAGLDQGFEIFAESPPPKRPRTYQPGGETLAAAKAALSKLDGNRPYFLWFHLFDPHTPYDPPAVHLEAMARDGAKNREKLLAHFRTQQGISPSFYDDDPERLLRTMNEYDAEIRASDQYIEGLYDFITERNLNDRTLWIIAGDHGEGMGSHEYGLHGWQLFDEQIRIPFIVHDTGGRLRTGATSLLTETVDLFPTLIEMAGAEGDLSNQKSRGRSVAAFIRTSAALESPREFAFSQRVTFSGKPPPLKSPPQLFLEGDIYSFHNQREKYLMHTAYEDAYYDVRSDPLETTNRLRSSGARAREIKVRLEEFVTLLENETAVGAPMDEEGLKALEALGYLR